MTIEVGKRFIKLRSGLLDHLKTGRMHGHDLGLYVALHYHADYQTGVVYHKSAPYFASLLHTSIPKAQRSLRRLEGRGYIKRFGHRGQVSGYDIIINKYIVQLKCKSNGTYSQVKCILISADKSLSTNEIAWTVTEACNLKVGQNELKCRPSVVQLSSIIDIKNIRLLDEKDDQANRPGEQSPPTKINFQEFVTYWNSKESLPQIKAFSKQRKEKLKIRMGEKLFAENWRLVIDKLATSPFHTGQSSRGWKANVDWLLTNDVNYLKIYELEDSPDHVKPLERNAQGLTPLEVLEAEEKKGKS